MGVVVTVVALSIAALVPPVQLTSTLFNGDTAYEGQQVVFTCVTTGTDDILTWRSEHYIEGILQVSFHDPLGSTDSNPQNPSTVATLINATSNGGVIVIESRLRITASMQNSISSVSCQINSIGLVETITFRKDQFISRFALIKGRDVKYPPPSL